jgi:hypothetical protein
MSACAYSPFDRAQRTAGTLPPADIAARLAAIRAVDREAALPRLWRELPQSTRTVLVMLACGQRGDPYRIAKQPWDSFSRVDQESIASTCRQVVVDLSQLAAVA